MLHWIHLIRQEATFCFTSGSFRLLGVSMWVKDISFWGSKFIVKKMSHNFFTVSKGQYMLLWSLCCWQEIKTACLSISQLLFYPVQQDWVDIVFCWSIKYGLTCNILLFISTCFLKILKLLHSLLLKTADSLKRLCDL